MEQKNATNKGLIIGLIIESLVIVGLAITLVLMLVLRNGDNGNNGGNTTDGGHGEELVDYSVQKRNNQRKDDLARIMTAVNDYQTNNSGKTPWDSGELNAKFVERYIDAKCVRSSEKGGKSIYSKCGAQFTDPDGSNYSFDYAGEIKQAGNSIEFDSVLGEWPNNHAILVSTYAKCGDGAFAFSPSHLDIAMAYRLEDNSYTCIDNQ